MKGYKIHKRSRTFRVIMAIVMVVLAIAFLYGAYVLGQFGRAMYVVLAEVL